MLNELYIIVPKKMLSVLWIVDFVKHNVKKMILKFSLLSNKVLMTGHQLLITTQIYEKACSKYVFLSIFLSKTVGI